MADHRNDLTSSARPANWRPWLVRGVALAAVATLIGVAWFTLGDELALDRLAAREAQFQTLAAERPTLTYGGAFALYVGVTALSLPFAAGISLVYGWLFGFWPAVVLVSFASSCGATLAFLLSRYLLGDWLQARYAAQLARFNAELERDGPYYLLTLRLIPLVPFFLINLLMGLTRMRAFTFYWVSQVGMLPGTAAYVFAGASAPSLRELAEQGPRSVLRPELLAALAVLVLLPVVLRRIVGRRRSGE